MLINEACTVYAQRNSFGISGFFALPGTFFSEPRPGRLGLSPQGLSEIWSGRNSPSAEVVLNMLELMNDPKNLNQAREQIESLEQEIVKLKAAPPAAAVAASPAPTPKAERTERTEFTIPIRAPKEFNELSTEELRIMLNATKSEPIQQKIYARLKVLERERKLPPYRR